MNRLKKTAILVWVLLTASNIVACGQVKEEETVNAGESAGRQESNAQTDENTDVETNEEETVNAGESSAGQQGSNAQTDGNTDVETNEEETVNTEESEGNGQDNSGQAAEGIHSETTEDISGNYIYSVDDSTLSVIADMDNTYHAEAALYGLTYIDDFAGKYENGVLTITGTDSSGNPITAEITFSNGQATLTFTDSTWEYLENGTQYVFDKE